MRKHEVDEVRRLIELRPSDQEHDIWRLLCTPETLASTVNLMCDSLDRSRITHICGPEARGFLLGGLVAHEMSLPFLPARKVGTFLPGEVISARTKPDWEGKQVTYAIRARSIPPGSNVALVDDWFTTGNHFRAIRSLVEAEGSRLDHARVIVTELSDGLDCEGVDLRAVLHWCPTRRAFHEGAGQLM